MLNKFLMVGLLKLYIVLILSCSMVKNSIHTLDQSVFAGPRLRLGLKTRSRAPKAPLSAHGMKYTMGKVCASLLVPFILVIYHINCSILLKPYLESLIVVH